MKKTKIWIRRLFVLQLALELLAGNLCVMSQSPSSSVSVQQRSSDEAIAILEKYVLAIGGFDAWKGIKSTEIVSENEVFGSINKIYRLEDHENGRYYQRSETPNGPIELGFDGKRAWRRAVFFRGYLPDSDPQARTATKRRPPLWDFKNIPGAFERMPDETISKQPLIVLKNTQLDALDRAVATKYYFDPVTFFLRQTVSGNEITQTTVFDDYRDVDGKKVAFKTSITTPQATIKSKVVSVKYNVSIDPSKFELDPTGKSDPATGSSSLTPASASVGASTAEKIREDAFELVWRTINDSYWDRTFGGVDWQGVHDSFLPRVRKSEESDQFHRLLNEMVGKLHRSHFKIIPPQSVVGLHSAATDLKNASVGLNLRWLDSHLLVESVQKDSPADSVGIRPGFRVTKVGDRTIEEIYKEHLSKAPGFLLKESFERVRAVMAELRGKAQSSVNIEILDGEDKARTFNLTREARPSTDNLQFEARRITDRIGYIKFNLFLGDTLPKFQAAMNDLRDTKSVILDLRGNPGGVGQIAPAIASLLFESSGSLGRFRFRYDTQSVAFQGTGNAAYRGKIVILVDEQTGSTAEVLSGGLQEIGRCTVIGTTTAGAVLPSLIQPLPTGGALQYVVSSFETPKGVTLEGRGVLPDMIVETSRKDLLSGHDKVLEKAIEFAEAH